MYSFGIFICVCFNNFRTCTYNCGNLCITVVSIQMSSTIYFAMIIVLCMSGNASGNTQRVAAIWGAFDTAPGQCPLGVMPKGSLFPGT